jgi:hypothetical protein
LVPSAIKDAPDQRRTQSFDKDLTTALAQGSSHKRRKLRGVGA